jgi:hypothetical protein
MDTGAFGYAKLGIGVLGYSFTSESPAVFAKATGTGAALRALTSAGRAMAVTSDEEGSHQGVWAEIGNPSNTRDSVRAETTGQGAGIYATSVHGPGGKFGGATAQMLLVPSQNTDHPGSGAAGTLFVDKWTRLWFCHGGTSWTQLA